MSLKTLGLATAAQPERRRSARRKVESLIYLMIPPGNGGILHDISENGMGVSMANPLGAESDCRFSILRQNRPPIRGIGRVAWVSKSGKAVGLRFVELTEESRRQIQQWMEFGEGDRETGADANGARKTEAAAERIAPPAEEAAQSPRPEANAAAKKIETPLYFLPQRRMDDEPEPETQIENALAAPASEGPSGIEEMRMALREPSKSEKKKGRRQDILFVVQVLCVAAIALASGFLLIYKGEDALQYVKRHAPFDLTLRSATNVEPASSGRARTTKPRRRTRFSPRETAKRDSAASTPAVWRATSDGVPFQLEVTDSFNRRWLITASGQKVLKSNRQIALGNDATPAPPPVQTTEQAEEPAEQPEGEGNAASAAGTRAPVVSAHASKGANGNAAAGPRTIVAPKLQTGTDAPFTVVLDALIGKDGSVKNVRVVRSPSAALAWAVVEAVKQWHYPPFYQNGQPAEVVTRITVAFEGNPEKR